MASSNQIHPRPVILVHGFLDTSARLTRLGKYLRELGWTVYLPTLAPSNGTLGIDKLAGQLDAFIRQHCGDEQPIDLVGFSMGGIITRYYLQRLGGAARVRNFVSISSPHQGTWIAYGWSNEGTRQMRAGSPFLTDLNRDVEMLKDLNCTTMRTPIDLMIRPSKSSCLPFGKQHIFWVPAHPLMVWNRTCLKAVAEALQAE
jgi:triacylglycerol lipase